MRRKADRETSRPDQADTSMIGALRLRYVLALVIISALAIQINTLVRSDILPTARSTWNMRQYPAWERSATILGGRDFADYIKFVRDHTPADARIILPPRVPVRPVAHVGLMQYFLFPRDIHNCGIREVEACVRRVRGSNTYILAVDGFPPRDLAELSKYLIQYEDELGVYAPRPKAEANE